MSGHERFTHRRIDRFLRLRLGREPALVCGAWDVLDAIFIHIDDLRELFLRLFELRFGPGRRESLFVQITAVLAQIDSLIALVALNVGLPALSHCIDALVERGPGRLVLRLGHRPFAEVRFR